MPSQALSTPNSKPWRTKAERTRAAILAAAERQFAQRGFRETRLEDVADEVGLKRAALFYHFRDKRALYEAVVEDVFADLLARLEAVLAGRGPLADRIDASIEVWVDALAARPAMARLILRKAADAPTDDPEPIFPRAPAFLAMGRRLFEEGQRSGELNPIRPDPFHVISAIVGASVFYFAALRSVLPGEDFDPLAPAELAAHRRDLVRTARRLLGVGAPRPVPPPASIAPPEAAASLLEEESPGDPSR